VTASERHGSVPVAGIDGWREGWVLAELGDEGLVLDSVPRIDELVPRLRHHRAVGIDMPIALVAEGRRVAESELRAALGRSARSVFTSPTRAAVEAVSQAEATVVNRRQGGPGISAQAFGLFASIRQVRTALGGADHLHWHETHPETAFTLLNDGVPLPSKRSALGVGLRLALLRSPFGDLDHALTVAPERVPIDDALDAVAALWSARRVAEGTARRFGPPGRDDQGFEHGVFV